MERNRNKRASSAQHKPTRTAQTHRRAAPTRINRNEKFAGGGGFFSLLGIILIFIGGFLRIVGIAILFVLAVIALLRLEKKTSNHVQNSTHTVRYTQPIPTMQKPNRLKTDRSLKPYNMPRVYGAPLAYEYNDVDLFIPHDLDTDLPDIYHALLTLRPEPQNPYDTNSIAAYYNKYANGRVIKSYHLGYMYSGTLRDMVQDYIKAGRHFLAIVENFDREQKKLVYHLGFYYFRDLSSCPIYKLVNTAGKRTQENISDYCVDGAEVEISIADNGKYAALSSGELIGYFPSRAEETVSEFPLCAVDRIEADDSGKQTVFVVCFVGTSDKDGRH